MPKRSSTTPPKKRPPKKKAPARKKNPRDPNQLAAAIVAAATGDAPEAEEPAEGDTRNQAAVELGRMGGKKGGPARAAKLSKKRRSEIAKKAAAARWGKKSTD